MNNREAAEELVRQLFPTCGEGIPHTITVSKDATKNRTDLITAALDARDEKLVAAAREVLEALTCPDCAGRGTLGDGDKPIACETCGGDEDSRGSGYAWGVYNVDEKLDALAALVEGVGK